MGEYPCPWYAIISRHRYHPRDRLPLDNRGTSNIRGPRARAPSSLSHQVRHTRWSYAWKPANDCAVPQLRAVDDSRGAVSGGYVMSSSVSRCVATTTRKLACRPVYDDSVKHEPATSTTTDVRPRWPTHLPRRGGHNIAPRHQLTGRRPTCRSMSVRCLVATRSAGRWLHLAAQARLNTDEPGADGFCVSSPLVTATTFRFRRRTMCSRLSSRFVSPVAGATRCGLHAGDVRAALGGFLPARSCGRRASAGGWRRSSGGRRCQHCVCGWGELPIPDRWPYGSRLRAVDQWLREITRGTGGAGVG